MKKLIIIGVLSIFSLIIFISFCLNKMSTAAFIAFVPAVVFNSIMIFYGCYHNSEDDE